MNNQHNSCIWMEAGVIDYQLCPLNYNCDSCEIHRQLTQRMAPSEVSDPSRGLVYFNTPDPELNGFRAGYNFLPGYIWVRRQTNARVRLGINPFLWQIFPALEKILLPLENRHIEDTDCIAWMIFRNGMIGVRSPLSGTIRARNQDLDGNILNPLNFRYKDGFDTWLIELETDADSLPEMHWSSREEVETALNTSRTILLEYSTDSEINLSMTKGQEALKTNWNKLIVEKPTYSNLLKKLTGGTLFVC